MKKKYGLILFILCFCSFLTACRINETVQVMQINDSDYEYCKVLSFTQQNEEKFYNNDVLEFNFEYGDFYFNKLLYAGENSDEFYTYTIELLGNQIEISYVDTDEQGQEYLKTTNDYNNLPNKTLYISTDLENIILSVPTVYNNMRIYDSIQTESVYEQPVSITSGDGVYYLTYAFPKNSEYTSEFFYLQSGIPLVVFNDDIEKLIIQNELSGRFRLLEDGFYQISYDTYYPTGKGNYFRNCANYIATHYVDYNNSVSMEDCMLFFDYISYASTYIVDMQISEYGFFETKSRSDWLFKDFLINKDFYDTRFNADNAELNIKMYKRFNDEFFLDTLNTYATFFVNYANEHSYKTDRGILVEDYYNPEGGLRTHVSLNHQLANLNVLLALYEIEPRQEYFDTAMLMLYGIEDTKDEWILEDNNLAYALYYSGTNNVMKDYPYLTYNDLYITRERLNEIGVQSDAIEDLMDSKMIYMNNNGITGYLGE